MKVLHIISGVDPRAGGPSRSVPCLCSSLAEAGVETWLYSHRPEFTDKVDFGAGFLVAGSGGGYFQTCREVVELALRCKPDIIHVHALWSLCNHAAVRYAVRNRIPGVISTRGMLDPWALRQKPLKKKVALRLYQRRDLTDAFCFHATAEQEARNIRAQGLKQPIIAIPNGVDLPVALPMRQVRADEKKTALFLSRLHPGKGLLDLVAAWECVRPKGWRMRIVGPDSYGHQAVVQAEIRRLGWDEDFEFAGERDDVAKWQEYVNADLFVHPSHSENFGISIAEALAAGLPVITTKGTPWQELEGEGSSAACAAGSKVQSRLTPLVQGMSEGLAHGDINDRSTSAFIPHPPSFAANGCCGWWIDIGVEPLAEALKEAMGLSDEERRAMGENGRKLVQAKYTWPAISLKMKQAYEWILHGGDRPEFVDVI